MTRLLRMNAISPEQANNLPENFQSLNSKSSDIMIESTIKPRKKTEYLDLNLSLIANMNCTDIQMSINKL